MMVTEHATISRKKEIRTITGDKGTISTQLLCIKVGYSPTQNMGQEGSNHNPKSSRVRNEKKKEKQVSKNHYNADHSQINLTG
jgi:hypothetical protein